MKIPTMKSAELKSILIEKITLIKDTSYLEALNSFLVLNEPQEVYHLSEEQEQKIKKSDAQIKAGKFLENDKVFEKLEKKWLKRK